MATSSLRATFTIENDEQAKSFIDAYEQSIKNPPFKPTVPLNELKGKELEELCKRLEKKITA